MKNINKKPKLVKLRVNGKEFYFTEEEFKKHAEFYENIKSGR